MKKDDENDGGRKNINVIVNERVMQKFKENTWPTLLKIESEMIKESAGAAEIFAIHDDIAAFGNLLRQCRVSSSLTQDELARRSGVARSTIASIECGIMHDGPTVGTVSKLLRGCGKRPIPCVDDVWVDHRSMGADSRDQESADSRGVEVVAVIPFVRRVGSGQSEHGKPRRRED